VAPESAERQLRELAARGAGLNVRAALTVALAADTVSIAVME
jgi:hypothetical protein